MIVNVVMTNGSSIEFNNCLNYDLLDGWWEFNDTAKGKHNINAKYVIAIERMAIIEGVKI